MMSTPPYQIRFLGDRITRFAKHVCCLVKENIHLRFIILKGSLYGETLAKTIAESSTLGELG